IEVPEAPSEDGDHSYRHTDIAGLHGLTGKRLSVITAIDLPGGGALRLAFEGGKAVILHNTQDFSVACRPSSTGPLTPLCTGRRRAPPVTANVSGTAPMLAFHDWIPEIAGGVCTALLAQQYWYRGKLVAEANVLFLKLQDRIWHRFFIDGGVVFWRTVDAPDDPADEGHHRYVHLDLGAAR